MLEFLDIYDINTDTSDVPQNTTQMTPTMGWIPPANTEVLCKRVPAKMYWNVPQASNEGIVKFVDDDGNERPFKVNDVLGVTTGATIPDANGEAWIEITARYFRPAPSNAISFFSAKGRIQYSAAWVYSGDDMLTSRTRGGGSPLVMPTTESNDTTMGMGLVPTIKPPTPANTGINGGLTPGGATNLPVVEQVGAAVKSYWPYAIALVIAFLVARKKKLL